MSFDLRHIGNDQRDTAFTTHPLAQLPRQDLDLICELVLRSGSLKELASAYGVSYPTIRARLDKTIERLRAAAQGQKRDPMTDLLATLLERGELSFGAARAIRDLARRHSETTGGAP